MQNPSQARSCITRSMVFNFQHYYFILKSEELFVKECLTEKIPVLIDYIHWYI